MEMHMLLGVTWNLLEKNSCPQFDGLVGVLTGREMVELFARLRGVQNVSKDCEKWLSKVGLTESKNVQCIKYSGGMKRRLSAAMVQKVLF